MIFFIHMSVQYIFPIFCLVAHGNQWCVPICFQSVVLHQTCLTLSVLSSFALHPAKPESSDKMEILSIWLQLPGFWKTYHDWTLNQNCFWITYRWPWAVHDTRVDIEIAWHLNPSRYHISQNKRTGSLSVCMYYVVCLQR